MAVREGDFHVVSPVYHERRGGLVFEMRTATQAEKFPGDRSSLQRMSTLYAMCI